MLWKIFGSLAIGALIILMGYLIAYRNMGSLLSFIAGFPGENFSGEKTPLYKPIGMILMVVGVGIIIWPFLVWIF